MADTTKRRTGKRVFCRNDQRGAMDFYLDLGSEHCFLFRTRYFSRAIFREYQFGKPFEAVLKYTPQKRHNGLSAKRLVEQRMKLKERITRTVKYIDREFNASFDGAVVNREVA